MRGPIAARAAPPKKRNPRGLLVVAAEPRQEVFRLPRQKTQAVATGPNGRFAADVAHYGVSWAELLTAQPDDSVDCSFTDPQWRSDLDKLKYGNEGARQRARCALPQQTEADIIAEFTEICRVTKVGGYAFLWTDHVTVCEGDLMRFCGPSNPHRMRLVDLIVWFNPSHMTSGSRSRTVGAFLVAYQKQKPTGKANHRANWLRSPCIKRVWTEGISQNQKKQTHTHAKPILLQATLIECVTPKKGGLVLDANAGSFSVLQAAHSVGRHFIGCELLTPAELQEINANSAREKAERKRQKKTEARGTASHHEGDRT